MTDAFPSAENLHTSFGIATTADGPEALEKFLAARGLDPETAAKFGLTASGGRIEIPYLQNGAEIFRKVRGIVEKTFSIQPAGKHLCLWNVDVLADETLADYPLIIAEGEFDALAAIQCGYPRTVSVPNGAPGQRDTAKLEYLDEVEGILRKLPEIIIAADADEVGANLLHDLSHRLGRARCKWLKYPKGCKDLNDALRLFGPAGVHETVRRAQWVKVDGVHAMSELPPLPARRGYHVGIPGLEVRLRLGDMSIMTGVPGHGKTTLVNDILCRILAGHEGLRGAIASFEQAPQTDHRRALRTWHGGRLVKDLTDAELLAADRWIDEKLLFIVPSEDDDVTLDWLLERMTTAAVRHGCQFIVVDPWNEMDHHKPKDMTMTDYTGFAIKQFKRFANKYQVHVMVVAHPAKMQRGKDGTYPVPTLYDVADSAHWSNKPDLGIVVYRDKDGRTSVNVAKSRYHGEIGKPQTVDVTFSYDSGRFTVVDNGVMSGRDRGSVPWD